MSTISILNATDKEIRQRFSVSRSVIILLLLLGTFSHVHADKVDDYIKAEMAKNRIPGLALAVVKDGKIVKAKGYGLANLELNVPATADTVFPIASITKPFTALGIMMLVEEGKVGLDEKIGKYLANAPNTWSNVTVRHLLTHTSGIGGRGMGSRTNANEDRWTVKTAQWFGTIRPQPLNFPPGERWQYSGQGYFLLGMIIESASGQSYRDFLKGRVFRPAGMTSTFVRDYEEVVKHRAGTYNIRDGKLLVDWRPLQVELPADAGIISTANDLAKWERALYSAKLVKRSTLDQMWKPGRLNNGALMDDENSYGFGWGVHDYRGYRTIGHAGSSGAQFLSFPENKLTVIMLCNLGFSDWADQNNIAQTVAGMYERTLRPPEMLTPQSDRDPESTKRLLGFLEDLASGKDSSLATPGMRAWLSENQKVMQSYREYAQREKTDLASLMKTVPLSAQLKDSRSFTFIACDRVEGRDVQRLGFPVSRISYFKLVTTKKSFFYTFWRTAEGQVADFAPKDYLHD